MLNTDSSISTGDYVGMAINCILQRVLRKLEVVNDLHW